MNAKQIKKEKIDLITQFLNTKQHILNICDISDKDKYITAIDLNDISKWKDKHLNHVYEDLICNLCDLDFLSAFKTCPFCIYMSITESGDCAKCEYGKRHGICNQADSEYQILIYPVLSKNAIKVYTTLQASEEFRNLQVLARKLAEQLSLFDEVTENDAEGTQEH